jgi:hypothetical protein
LSRIRVARIVGIELVDRVAGPPRSEVSHGRIVYGIPGMRATEKIVQERVAGIYSGRQESEHHEHYEFFHGGYLRVELLTFAIKFMIAHERESVNNSNMMAVYSEPGLSGGAQVLIRSDLSPGESQ